jgi:hypothetical protein
VIDECSAHGGTIISREKQKNSEKTQLYLESLQNTLKSISLLKELIFVL